jgi:hypothetical protein
MGDTKLLCKVGKVTIEFLGVRGEHKGSGKPLVLCHDERVKASRALMCHTWLSVSLVLIRRDLSMLTHDEL